ncbi:hypothetical protein [Myxococcus sp. AM010]|uniref:hypothetical protein n=1 Tax=Myxococcus sp. AM010 TaxID=2745138 RepID=UPI0015959D55|nr:hypothetical protein [Myxococcus sp. AM010]NVJ13121.1 hypothetical protein [Myxococcus sp. AM010]
MVRQFAVVAALPLLVACEPGERETGNRSEIGDMEGVGSEGVFVGAQGGAQSTPGPVDVVIDNTGSMSRLVRVNVSVLGPWTGNNNVSRVMGTWETIQTIEPHTTLNFPAVVNAAGGARVVTNAHVLREVGGLTESGGGYDFAPFSPGTKCVATISDAQAPNGARMHCNRAE